MALDLGAIYQRALGSYLGLALGDALGATVEFLPRDEIRKRYGVHRQIVGGGWLDLPAGAVTDDTEMSLALGEAIVARAGFEPRAAAERFAAWLRGGPRDCGHTCRRGIRRFLLDGSVSGAPNAGDGGNGAVMRNLPLVLATLGDPSAFEAQTLAQCHITHHHPYSDGAALALGRMAGALILGEGPAQVEAHARLLRVTHPVFDYAAYDGPAGAYVVETVCTVLRHFFDTQDFESCVVATVNRGDDADTTGALAGMLAGARAGRAGLPERWVRRLDPAIRATIERQTRGLLALSPMFSMHGGQAIR